MEDGSVGGRWIWPTILLHGTSILVGVMVWALTSQCGGGGDGSSCSSSTHVVSNQHNFTAFIFIIHISQLGHLAYSSSELILKL
jgi:hypothetical protein